ncbi:MAG: 2-hydroxyacid dehydrogenase [Rhodospirillales bacterium]|nr:2-hydroxyacid dehydrogenase [Rhodospirillales bacterium]
MPADAPIQVLFHASAGPDLRARLAACAGDGLAIAVCPETDADRLAALLPTTDVLWHVLAPATAGMIAQAPRLKLIQKIGVGVNTIDLEAARARGIPVCNLPGTNARAVAELTLALMLATLRRLPMFDAATRAGRGFALDPAQLDGLGELGGRSVGLVGYGAVPQVLAPILAALGCTLLYTARTPRSDAIARFVPLDTLISEADIVSLHLPLTAETTHLIDAARLARMRPGSILINTARGGLIDQPALAAALRTGPVVAAGLDVFDPEPPPEGHPILALPNTVLTPHIAWLTSATFDRSLVLATENCRRLHTGMPLLHRVA